MSTDCAKPSQRCRKNVIATLGNSVIWTAAILAVSALTEPIGGNSWTVTGLLVAGWFGTHVLIQGNK